MDQDDSNVLDSQEVPIFPTEGCLKEQLTDNPTLQAVRGITSGLPVTRRERERLPPKSYGALAA
jgi:hypothetical protein